MEMGDEQSDEDLIFGLEAHERDLNETSVRERLLRIQYRIETLDRAFDGIHFVFVTFGIAVIVILLTILWRVW